MLEVYKPHTNREAVGVWLCSAAKRPSKRSALVVYKVAKFPYGQIHTNIYCPDKDGFTFSNMFDIQISKDKLNFGANYQRNGNLILNFYKNVARLRDVSGTWRSGCWRFDCM